MGHVKIIVAATEFVAAICRTNSNCQFRVFLLWRPYTSGLWTLMFIFHLFYFICFPLVSLSSFLLKKHVKQEPEKPDALAGQTSLRRENFTVFSQANCMLFIPKYTLQWFSQDESLLSWGKSFVSRDETLVLWETRRGVVTYFWAVL